MNTRTPPSTTIFSRWVSWVGILILGAGVASSTPQSAHASSAVASASLHWSIVDQGLGLLEGGLPVNYSTGVRGWTERAFSQLGDAGIEWVTVHKDNQRSEYAGGLYTETRDAGGASTWTTIGAVSANPVGSFRMFHTVSIEHNQAQFAMRLEPFDDNAMGGKRIYWGATLPATFQPTYSGAGTGTLVVTDTSHTHPTLVMHGASGAGTVTWGGPEIYTDPLEDGERNPTLYVHSTTEDRFTITVTLGLVDRDPCSATQAATFATEKAGVFGQAWAPITSCLQPPDWAVTADGEPTTLSLNTGETTTALPTGHTRTLAVAGLPEGVTWERQANTGTSLALSLVVPTPVEAGTYPLTITTGTAIDSGGVVTASRTASTAGFLVVSAAPPVVVPLEPEPELVPELESEVPGEPASVSSSSSSTRSALTPQPAPEPAPVAPLSRTAPVIDQPDLMLPAPAPTPAQAREDPEVPREPSYLKPADPVIPEPANASAWLGASLGVMMLGGLIIAGVRRHRKEEDVAASGRT